MAVQTLHMNGCNGKHIFSDSNTKMMAEIMMQLMTIENNTRDSKIKEMVWHPSRDDPVDVYLRTSVVMVGDIDAKKQEFLCEFYLSVKWREPRLKGRTNKSQIDWDKEWEPDIYFVDMISCDISERHRSILEPKHGAENDVPTVLFYYHIRGIFKTELNVENFPFDYQKLDITVTSNMESSQIAFWDDKDQNHNIRVLNFTAKHEWDLQPHVLSDSGETKTADGSSFKNYPLYYIQMHVRRKWPFFIYNIAFVMALITALTFTSFAVETNSTSSRIQITITLLLASVAFKYYLVGYLPTVPYLTMIEQYIQCCFVFQVIVSILHALSGIITNIRTMQITEWASLRFSATLFLLVHMWYFIRVILAIRDARRQKDECKKKYKGKSKKCDYEIVSYV